MCREFERRIALRRDNVLQYVLADHLGSTTLVLDQNGAKVDEIRYYPYGAERWPLDGTFPTDYRFTGQRNDGYIKLYIMGARWYDPELGRWISPDVIVPGAAAGSGGGAATLGYDDQIRLTPLTVGFHETQFLSVVGDENREIAAKGFWFQRSEEEKGKSKYQWGPINPQALNRYAYCLGNALRYVDPTGRYEVDLIDVDLTAGQVLDLLAELDWWLAAAGGADDLAKMLDAAGVFLELGAAVGATSGVGVGAAVPAALGGACLLAVGLGLDWTVGDLEDLRYALAMASDGGQQGVHLTMGGNVLKWGIEVNNQEVFGHLQFSGPGRLSASWQFMMAWWVFDYDPTQ